MRVKAIYLIVLVFPFFSCTQVYLKVLTRKPKIESQASITDFLVRNKFDTSHSYYLGGDIHVANEILKEHFLYSVFDSLGNQLNNENFICTFNTIASINSKHPDSLLTIQPDKKNIFSLVEGVKKLNGAPFDRSVLANHKYYIVVFWQKFMGGRKGYKENVESIVRELSKQDSTLILKINADMMLPPADAPKTKFKMQLLDRDTKPFFKVRKSVL